MAVVAIAIGITLQVMALAKMLAAHSLLAKNYNNCVRLFLAGLGAVAGGVVLAMGAEIFGLGQKVLG